tara:strand:+ start:3394 stop:3792 length:399 start_codon:yes stop_codon:yes gene_type:complete
MIIVIAASHKVILIDSITTSKAGLCFSREVPKSPLNILMMKFLNWINSGSEKPYFFEKAIRASSEAFNGRYKSVGSPVRRARKKTRISSPMREKILWARRFIKKLDMAIPQKEVAPTHGATLTILMPVIISS